MGCVFCASGLDGVVRNLTTGEILEQLLRLKSLLPADERLSHIVVMGMGEPLANLDRLLPALALAQDPDGLGISQRRITISTVGLPPAIDRLTAENPGYHLAVSLHAADDELRTRLVPVNKSVGLAGIMDAADRYWEASGRRLTFEYVLLGGVNDAADDAAKLELSFSVAIAFSSILFCSSLSSKISSASYSSSLLLSIMLPSVSISLRIFLLFDFKAFSSRLSSFEMRSLCFSIDESTIK
jgi:adenine C2-methylase RlmN of 23S rRNA A2503 and tRNA A37